MIAWGRGLCTSWSTPATRVGSRGSGPPPSAGRSRTRRRKRWTCGPPASATRTRWHCRWCSCRCRSRRPPGTGCHLDLATTSSEHQQAEVRRLLALGAAHADIGQGDVPWTVLADPEGNEFCVLEPRPVYAGTGPVAAVVAGCADPAALAGFWELAAGFTRVHSEDGFESLRSPAQVGPFLELLRVPGAKTVKNRVHLDVRAAGGRRPGGGGRRTARGGGNAGGRRAGRRGVDRAGRPGRQRVLRADAAVTRGPHYTAARPPAASRLRTRPGRPFRPVVPGITAARPTRLRLLQLLIASVALPSLPAPLLLCVLSLPRLVGNGKPSRSVWSLSGARPVTWQAGTQRAISSRQRHGTILRQPDGEPGPSASPGPEDRGQGRARTGCPRRAS